MTPVETIDRKRAFTYLFRESQGLIFSCTFRKKDGNLRHMTCRTGVRKYTKGGTLNYSPRKMRYVPVCDIDLVRDGIANPYRTINVNTLVEFNIHGTKFLVVDN